MLSLRETTVAVKDRNYHVTIAWTRALWVFQRESTMIETDKIELYLGTRLASWGVTHAVSWDLILSSILGCHYLEIVNNLIFEFVFCKWIPKGQWGMCMSGGCVFDMGAHLSSPPRLLTEFTKLHEQRTLVDPQCVGGKGDPKQAQETVLHLCL